MKKTGIFKYIWQRKWRFLGGFILALILWGVIYFAGFDEGILDRSFHSTTFLDRNGVPLRTFFSRDEKYADRCQISEVSPHFLRAIVLIEDKKFYSHKGVVPSSLIRALWQNLKGGRVVSGGSTITMQLAKMVYEHRSRSIFNKISEIFSALRFELHVSKSRILEEYINRLPFGNMIYGIKTASHFYFEKDPGDLSLNQAIYLALIPKSPSRYNPGKHMKTLEARRLWILDAFKEQKYISLDEYRRARAEGIRFAMKDYPFLAPHFIDLLKEKFYNSSPPPVVHTTLDIQIQKELEGIVRAHLVRLKPYKVNSAAAVIIDNRTRQVVGFLGSPGYFKENISGYVNLAVSLRQPGSTLKPFVYALALENGYTPSSILPDIKFPSKGGFFPKNHDGREHGPLRLRVALGCSYNIPAFYMAMKLKPQLVIEKLREAGFSYIKNEPGFYGETIALGSGEVKLLDLVTAYSVFANRGTLYFPAMVKDQPIVKKEIFPERVAFLTWHILSDPAARFPGFGYESSMNLPFPLAVKTGTSKGFRDKWAVGVNSEYTVGVWLGNPTGENMRDLSGVGNAATVLRDVFLAIQKDWTRGDIPVPAGIITRTICPLSGELLGPDCPDALEEYFLEENQPPGECSYHQRVQGRVVVRYPELYREWAGQHHLEENISIGREKSKRISFPQQGDFFYISDAIPRTDQVITFEAMGFEAGEILEFYLDGRLYKSVTFPGKATWQLQRGDHRLEVKSKGALQDSLEFIVR